MPELDGTAKHHEFLTPYDAHDKVLRDSSGYEHQEFPKAVDHEQKTDAPEGHFEPVLADGPHAEHQEYPKAVDHVQKTDAPEGHFEPVLADGPDAEEEEE